MFLRHGMFYIALSYNIYYHNYMYLFVYYFSYHNLFYCNTSLALLSFNQFISVCCSLRILFASFNETAGVSSIPISLDNRSISSAFCFSLHIKKSIVMFYLASLSQNSFSQFMQSLLYLPNKVHTPNSSVYVL